MPPAIAEAIDRAMDGGDMPRAVALARQALDTGYEHPLLFHLRAVSLKQQDRIAEALADLDRARQLAPRSAPLLIELSDCRNALGDHVGARASATEAVAIDPGQPMAWYQKGYAHQVLAEFEAANASFREALRLDPGLAEAQARLALIALGQGQYADARRFAQAALASDPGRPLALLAIASADRAEGKLDEAEPRLEAVLADPAAPPPVRAVARTEMGDILHARGRPDEAFKAWRSAADLWKSYYEPHVLKPGTERAPVQLVRLTRELESLQPGPW